MQFLKWPKINQYIRKQDWMQMRISNDCNISRIKCKQWNQRYVLIHCCGFQVLDYASKYIFDPLFFKISFKIFRFWTWRMKKRRWKILWLQLWHRFKMKLQKVKMKWFIWFLMQPKLTKIFPNDEILFLN